MAVRVDKYLWSVRLFKTRSIASEAVKKGKILINGLSVKPSRTITKGDQFEVKLPMITRKYQVKEELQNRVGAKLVADHLIDITPETELEKLELYKAAQHGQRHRGEGRPTKKERRDMDNVFESWDDWELDDED